MPCAELAPQARQRGAAVVLALVTLAIAAMLAAALLQDVGFALDSVQGRHEQAQARLLARGAVDWARNVLADDAQRSAADHPGEAWTVQVPPTPISDEGGERQGEVGGHIIDLSGRFNLNNLAPGGRADLVATEAFARLLAAHGLSAERARQLAQQLQRRLLGGPDADGDNRPGRPLAHEDALAHLPGFDAELLGRLRPLIAALPAPSAINVNTAPPEVLTAIVPGLDAAAAQALALGREQAWFRDLADFQARLPDAARAPEASRIAVGSRHFLVKGRARYGHAIADLEVLLDRRQTWPDILWQRIP